MISQVESEIPEENLETYLIMYAVETGLREMIIEVLAKCCGPKWWKQRIPPDVKTYALEGMRTERSLKWSTLVAHHPIYYTNFSDIRKIVTREDNWSQAFREIFGRKDLLTATLSEIEPIRNKIAHNRKVTLDDNRIVTAAYHKLTSAIGETNFLEYVSRCTSAPDIQMILEGLRTEADDSHERCNACLPLNNSEYWPSVKGTWWFDEDVLCHNLDGITNYFECLSEYRHLSRSRGQGVMIERWLKSVELTDKFEEASKAFSAIQADLEIR